MTVDIAARYVTCNATQAPFGKNFLFYPKGKAIGGTVRIRIDAVLPDKGSPKNHRKVRDALCYAAKYHPNFVVSMTVDDARNPGALRNVFSVIAAAV